MNLLTKCSTALSLIIVPVCTNLLAATPVAADADSHLQGFEVDTADWSDLGAGTVTRVPSGTASVPSFNGGYHATVPVATGNGPSTTWGGFQRAFPTDGYATGIAIYIASPLADGSDKRLDFSSAINQPTGDLRRDFVFHLGTKPGVSGVWCAAVSNNASDPPCNPGSVDRQPVEIGRSGWYQLVSIFRAKEGTNALEVEMQILDAASSVVKTWTLSDPTDIIGQTVGGNRSGRFVNNAFAGLAVDNSQRTWAPPMAAIFSGAVDVKADGKTNEGSVVHGFYVNVRRDDKGALQNFELRLARCNTPQDDCDASKKKVTASDAFEATSVTSLSVADDPRFKPGKGKKQAGHYDIVALTGTGSWKQTDGYTFEAVTIDRGEPGKGVDSFAITIRDAQRQIVAQVTAKPITSGNINTRTP
jgi:hypothetical protein